MTIDVALIGTTSSNSAVTQLQITGTLAAGSNAIFVAGPSGTSFTVSDNVNAGNYTQKRTATAGGAQVASFVKDGVAAGSTTITVSYGGSVAFVEIWGFNVTGTSGFDTDAAINSQTSGTTRTTNSATPTVQPGLAVGWLYNDSHAEGAVGAGYTAIASGSGSSFGSNDFFFSEKLRYTATSAQTAPFTATTSGGNTGALILLFKEAAGTAYTLSVADANVPVVGETVNLIYSGAAHSYTLPVGTGIVPIITAPTFADYALGISVRSVPVVGETVNFVYTPSGHNAYMLPISMLAVPVVGQNVNLIYGHPLTPITCSGGSFDSLTPGLGLTL